LRANARDRKGDVIIANSEVGVGSTFIASIPARYRPNAVEASGFGVGAR
jgi:hypothetical protein